MIDGMARSGVSVAGAGLPPVVPWAARIDGAEISTAMVIRRRKLERGLGLVRFMMVRWDKIPHYLGRIFADIAVLLAVLGDEFLYFRGPRAARHDGSWTLTWNAGCTIRRATP